jgi:glycosyltransferase involved in cell wall biosynthesis
MKILAIVPYLLGVSPGQRYRIEQWAPLLAKEGVRLDFAPFECANLNRRLYQPGQIGRKARLVVQAMSRRARLLSRASGYDAVYVYREAALLGPEMFEKQLARRVPLIYDFDDAIYLPAVSEANEKLAFLKSPQKVARICKVATHVMVGNKYLAGWASEHNANISVIPSTIDLNAYDYEQFGPSAREDKPGLPVIGWSGSTTTIAHLNTVRGALQKLAAIEPFKFRFIGPSDWSLEGVEVENVRWKSGTEARDLSALDIGLMPLPDEPWTQGKCAMKALQYMALGIPSVASPVGVNRDIIRHGENGFLASTEDEWVQVLATLLRDKKQRRAVGEAGRATIEAEFSAQVVAPRVAELFKSLPHFAGV